MKKIWLKIKELWSKITGKTLDFLRPNTELAIKIVDILKQVVENKVIDVATALTKSNLDNIIIAKIREILPKVAENLAITKEIIDAPQAEIMDRLLEFLKKQNKDVKATFYIALAGKINEYLSDGELSFSEAVSLAQIIYNEINKK